MAEKAINDIQLNYLVSKVIEKLNLKADDEDVVKSVNSIIPDDNGNIDLPKKTADDAMELLMDLNMIDPVTDENGAVYIENDNVIYTI